MSDLPVQQQFLVLMNLSEIENVDVPAAVTSYPSMTTAQEKALLYWCARDFYAGRGRIIDAGVFLGASTHAFAAGLADNKIWCGIRRKPIQSYDIAVWVASMDRYLEYPTVRDAFDGQVPNPGDSFEHILRRLLTGHEELVEFHVGNIISLAGGAEPVEIAFYDCLKSNDRDSAVFKAFAPHYIPGTTLVLQQDFFYESAAYNKIRQEYYADYFRFLGQVSNTAVFQYDRPIPAEIISRDPVMDLPVDQKFALLSQAVARAANNKTKILTDLSCVEFLMDEGEYDQALVHLDKVKSDMAKLSLSEITRRPETIARGFSRRIEAQVGQ